MTQEQYAMHLVSTEPCEWAADCIRGFWGYAVHIENGIWPRDFGFPAFTHEQMQEAKRINETLGVRCSWDEFPHLVYDPNADTWSEIYYSDLSDVADIMHPFVVDGVKLYALGDFTGWAWGTINEEWTEYITV